MRTSPLPPGIRRMPLCEQVEFLLTYQPPRGEHGEILTPPGALEQFDGCADAENCDLLTALRIVRNLVDMARLPADEIVWSPDGFGHSRAVEIYGYTRHLVLVQVRYVERARGERRPRQKLIYYVTDGVEMIEVPGTHIKRLAETKNASGMLAALRRHLPVQWQYTVPLPQSDAAMALSGTARRKTARAVS
jgi:hypothetical protein